MSGEITFHLADSYDSELRRYEGLIPQQISTKLPDINGLIVKSEIAEIQPKLNNDSKTFSEDERSNLVKPSNNNKNLNINSNDKKNAIPKTYTATLKLDPTTASLKTSQFMKEVMSHLQALPDADVEMSIDIEVRVPKGIDAETMKIVIENSNSLKVDNPEIF